MLAREKPQRLQNDENTNKTVPRTDINQSSWNISQHTHTRWAHTNSFPCTENDRTLRKWIWHNVGVCGRWICLQITTKLSRLFIRLPPQLALPTQHDKMWALQTSHSSFQPQSPCRLTYIVECFPSRNRNNAKSLFNSFTDSTTSTHRNSNNQAKKNSNQPLFSHATTSVELCRNISSCLNSARYAYTSHIHTHFHFSQKCITAKLPI